jgi:hypothetical protein
MKVTVLVDDDNKLSVGSWWATAPERVLAELRSQLAVAQCIWPELRRCAIVKTDGPTPSTALGGTEQ